jgi:hypothetical protein
MGQLAEVLLGLSGWAALAFLFASRPWRPRPSSAWSCRARSP